MSDPLRQPFLGAVRRVCVAGVAAGLVLFGAAAPAHATFGHGGGHGGHTCPSPKTFGDHGKGDHGKGHDKGKGQGHDKGKGKGEGHDKGKGQGHDKDDDKGKGHDHDKGKGHDKDCPKPTPKPTKDCPTPTPPVVTPPVVTPPVVTPPVVTPPVESPSPEPSSSPSASPSGNPSPSVEPSEVVNPSPSVGGEVVTKSPSPVVDDRGALPVTGGKLALLGAMSLLLLGGGVALVLVTRRSRGHHAGI
jgi:hypothetical protein